MIHRQQNILKYFSLFLTAFLVLIVASNCYAGLEILNYRYWTAPDHTRIVLDVDSDPLYKARERENLLSLSIPDASLKKIIPPSITLNKPGIKKITFHQTGKRNLKIDFFLDKYEKVNVFKLKKFQGKPDRIVVDIMLEETGDAAKPKRKTTETKKKRVIVIDPGHGGEDPGAIGKKGTYEKNIVLSIAREIKRNINQIPGYRAVLTRDGDYYVSFSRRLQKARDLQASLFISVHADAARNREAKGSTVYCLSTGAASNEAAKLLAHNENLSDIIGGESDMESNNESNPIIMNMFQTNTINLSKIYAEMLIKHLNSVNCLKFGIVQEAPFRVLKLPDIPAVLIETAYLSNPQEERLLKQRDFQENLALAISSSIEDYFSSSGQLRSADDETAAMEYKIIKGDTLFTIARRFNTKVGVLLKLNDMKLEDTLLIGQDILVPADKTDTKNHDEDNDENEAIQKKRSGKADKPGKRNNPTTYYTVKKGDTLFIVAKKHSTTLAELLKINHMKITDPLLYGQKIKIP
ncbi:MAG: N-acetylmuramoyl-L-alanine amidase [Syntrophaceae bacterium]|nr:N-acetylmuramoyl-L-alanine amidase [Syntrophaceae bacterium]